MGLIPITLWLASLSLIAAWAAYDHTRCRPKMGALVPRLGTVSTHPDGWEAEGEAWKEAGQPDVPEPDPDPESSFALARANYAWTIGFGRKAMDCPRCAAIRQERAKLNTEIEQENEERRRSSIPESLPLPERPKYPISVRIRAWALYCSACGPTEGAVYQMSEDTVMKYDPRFHRQKPESPAQDEAA